MSIDLTVCNVRLVGNVKTIGYFQKPEPFHTGPVDEVFLNALRSHVRNAFRVFTSMYGLYCSYCPSPDLHGQSEDDKAIAKLLGRAWTDIEFFVPSHEGTYFVSGLVEHLIRVHQYSPPVNFCTALQKCPRQGSQAFLEMLVQNGSTLPDLSQYPPGWFHPYITDEDEAEEIRLKKEACEARITQISTSIANDPSNASLYHDRSAEFLTLGNLDLALADERKAVLLAPRAGSYLLQRARILARLGLRLAALKDVSAAKELGCWL